MHCLDGSHITCRVTCNQGAYDQLQSEVFAKTGIPPNMQQLLANRKLVKSSSDLTENSTLNLKVRLCGDGNCDICYISGSLFICKECEQTLCAECNARVHQHLKRTHHKTNPLSECAENITSLEMSNSNVFQSLEDMTGLRAIIL